MNIRIFSFLVLVALLTSGVLGMLLMSVATMDGMPCAIPAMAPVDCIATSNALAMTKHHITAFQVLFTAVCAVVLSVLRIAFVRQVIPRMLLQPTQDNARRRHAVDREIFTSYRQRIQSWLACCLRRDAFAEIWVHAWSS